MHTYLGLMVMAGLFFWILVRTRRPFNGRVRDRIIGGGNRGPADKPYQNQIELLMGASFIQWILLCIHPRMYWCLNKTCGFKERNLHELYSI